MDLPRANIEKIKVIIANELISTVSRIIDSNIVVSSVNHGLKFVNYMKH